MSKTAGETVEALDRHAHRIEAFRDVIGALSASHDKDALLAVIDTIYGMISAEKMSQRDIIAAFAESIKQEDINANH